MKCKKKFICALLVMCYAAGSILPLSNFNGNTPFEVNASSGNTTIQNNMGASSVSDFLDVKKSDWFYSYLERLVNDGVINGKSKTEFNPTGDFSFAECSTVITRYLGLEKYASEKKEALSEKNPDSSKIWYSGYFQVMHELGIFTEDDGLFSVNNGYISAIDQTRANSPMKRHEFACAVAKSFQLNGTVRSKNIYSEVSGLGHDFIMGGSYSKDFLDAYSMFIKDFVDIPQSSKEYVQKLYYNGIFLGDTEGYFHPNDNIKRSEMAKVLATIKYFELRKSLITEYCPAVPQDKLLKDSDGKTELNYKYSLDILQKCAQGFDASGDFIKYKPSKTIPFGYAVDVYLYKPSQYGFTPVLQYSLADSDINKDGFEYSFDGAQNLRAIMVLRNLSDNAKPEFTLNVSISPDGITTRSMISAV